MNTPQAMMADAKFFSSYSRMNPKTNQRETWDEAVTRVMDMHRQKYAAVMTEDLVKSIELAETAYKQKYVLGAQRALQFGGEQLRKHEARCYNCSSTYADRPEFFNEAFYLLLCGVGVGFSVQKHHVAQLPQVAPRNEKSVRVFQVPDDIEGWADAVAVLLSSFFTHDNPFPSYKGCRVVFDYSAIRPKGAEISGGFKAPGPDGLRRALEKVEKLLQGVVAKGVSSLRPIDVYDITMHISDAVLSGGVRRSATICLFSKDDEEMLKAKTGDWFTHNPQRGRSNNSAVLLRDELTREEWSKIMESVKEWGEPGFAFVDNLEWLFNPCFEIGMMGYTSDYRSGFQFCNLVEINGSAMQDKAKFLATCAAAAVLGTLQAGYTDFKYLSPATKEITEREALLGVSITGWMNNPAVLFDADTLREGAAIIKEVNRSIAATLGIRPAARTTCVKPSGNASVLLGTASGIHPEHSPRYFRNVQFNEQEEILELIRQTNPKMVEKSVWSSGGTDWVVSFPIEPLGKSLTKVEVSGIDLLNYVKLVQSSWVEAGTAAELAIDPALRHNVSNTITVNDWDAVEEYLYQNRHNFVGVSLLADSGDKDWAQAPFTAVLTEQELLELYGTAALFASGLIVDGLHAFNGDLWAACGAVKNNERLNADSESLLKRDWVRRAAKFAKNYFSGNIDCMLNCLKDCHNLHRWYSITREFEWVDLSRSDTVLVEADSLGAQGCAGGACELSF